jgi:hypothetical protein
MQGTRHELRLYIVRASTSRLVRADMTNWEERINRGGDPSILIEHVVRYRFAAPLLAGADLWVDAACGTGYAPSLLLADLAPPPRRTLLADVDEGAVASAARALAALEPSTLVADLSTDDGLAALEEAMGPADGQRVAITSMETVEHLDRPMAFVHWLRDQAEHRGADVVLSVPNDAFWAMENPFHQTMWGEGAFEELRRLLPEHLAAPQFPMNGSYIVAGQQSGDTVDVAADISNARVPSHFLAAFGPRRDQLAPAAGATLTDLPARRRWEQQREADLAFLLAESLERSRAGRPDA